MKNKFKIFIALTDYAEKEETAEAPDKRKPNQKVQDILTEGTARQHWTEWFFPTIPGIDDYDDPQSKYGGADKKKKKKVEENAPDIYICLDYYIKGGK